MFYADIVVACVPVLLCIGLSKSLSMLMTQRFYISSILILIFRLTRFCLESCFSQIKGSLRNARHFDQILKEHYMKKLPTFVLLMYTPSFCNSCGANKAKAEEILLIVGHFITQMVIFRFYLMLTGTKYKVQKKQSLPPPSSTRTVQLVFRALII